MTSIAERGNNSTHRRTPIACLRCRQQKIKCSGVQPCDTCARRRLSCFFSKEQRISQSYVLDLERRLAAVENDRYPSRNEIDDAAENRPGENDEPEDAPQQRPAASGDAAATPQPLASHQSVDESATGINVLATGESFYVFDTQGKPVYLGTSSNWSFGRRVLLVIHDRINKSPLPSKELLWPDQVYRLGWDGDRSGFAANNDILLPDPDHAMYLIHAVKFHIGQFFHLFDDNAFMANLTRFHEPTSKAEMLNSLWYNHYLLILAFGKAFTSHENIGNLPSGCDLFTRAISTLPDLNFANVDLFEALEVLCCASLYLQSIDLRAAAYKMIGQALRTAMEQGLHTDMLNRRISGHDLERARKIWWTVHLLDRRMTSTQGLPLALRDEDISAFLPNFDGSSTKVRALDLYIKLSRTMAIIVNDIYGKEGRQTSRFLSHVKTALKDIAVVTDELNEAFRLSNAPGAGISRLSCHLHLLHHQCIVMATRPILFNFLEARLAHEDEPARRTSPPHNVWTLLHMCKESSLKMLNILVELQKQGLLESFLPFDLDATYTTAIVILMAAHIDRPLIEDHGPSMIHAYKVMQEMESRGNKIARILKSELQWMQSLLEQLPQQSDTAAPGQSSHDASEIAAYHFPAREPEDYRPLSSAMSDFAAGSFSPSSLLDSSSEGSLWMNTFSAHQMNLIAESIGSNEPDWWFNSI